MVNQSFTPKNWISVGNFRDGKDGLGSVVCSEHQLIEKLRLLLDDRFVMPSKYRKRVDDFFTYHYNKNC